jgi:membrane-associated protease RseP (regulator of RpoE activity)
MIIAFLISLIITVILHEAAHLIVAKKCGCGVIKYSIGFGKPILFSKKIGDTIYQLTPWIFLGGYCELKGELNTTEDKDAFINLPYRKKLAIVVAGCVINIITGIIASIVGLLINNTWVSFFGYLSILLGITNLLPLAPCLDGGYIVYYPLSLKIWGIEKGTEIFNKAVKISLIIVIALNILSIPLLIPLILSKGLTW